MLQFSSSVRVAHAALPQLAVAHSKLFELAAAALGFKSHAAYKALEEQFIEQSFCVFDHSAALLRAQSIGLSEADAVVVVDALGNAFFDSEGMRFYPTVEDYFDAIADELGTDALHSDEVNNAAAETNASFDMVEVLELDISAEFATLAPGDDFTVNVDGHVTMKQNQDRMFLGDKILFSVTCHCIKEVGNTFSVGEREIAAGVDQSPWAMDEE